MTGPYDLSHIRSGSDLSEAGDALLGGDLTADDLATLEDFATPKEFSPKILAAAILIHGASFFTTGIASGPPDAGDGLAAGVDAFQGASEILGSAGSDPGWQGAAALYGRLKSRHQPKILAAALANGEDARAAARDCPTTCKRQQKGGNG